MEQEPLKLKNVRSTKVPELTVSESTALLYHIHPEYPILRDGFRVGPDNFEME